MLLLGEDVKLYFRSRPERLHFIQALHYKYPEFKYALFEVPMYQNGKVKK